MSQDARNLVINEADLIRARTAALSFFGGSLDNKRPDAWEQFGYPTEVTFAQLLTAYKRGGAGQGAVHRLLDGCWEERPRIKKKGSEDVTPWEEGVSEVLKGINAWAKLRDFDRRNMVGHYAALIYRVGDGRALRDPLQKASRLVDLVPVYEDQIRVTAWNSDEASETYGQPTMFQYRTRPVAATADTQGRPETWVDVHPSRVQILAEGSVGDMFDGVPLLLAGFNDLIDIEKVKGGSAEGYRKNSARTVVFQYDKDANIQALQAADGSTKTVREVHEEQMKALNKNTDASIVIKGGEANTLQTQMTEPKEAFEVAANLFAASVRMPFTVLFGQQTGRLASDEDRADMVARCKSRQETELTPMLEQFVRRMQAAGLIKPGEFEIEWPDIGEPSDDKKLANSKTMAEVNQMAFNGGAMEPIFDGNEIRQAAGYEVREGGGDQFKEEEPPEDDVDPAAV